MPKDYWKLSCNQFLVKFPKIWLQWQLELVAWPIFGKNYQNLVAWLIFCVKFTKKKDRKGLILITSIWWSKIMSPPLFMLYLMYLMTKKSCIYHFHLARIIKLLRIFSFLYTINANDHLNQNFVYFMGVRIASFFLMLCEVNIKEIFKEI